MITDASTLDPGQTLQCDVCVIGGGATGITLALELDKPGLSVILPEAGGRRFNEASQSLYREEQAAVASVHADAHVYRRRVWGGSTSIWDGRCVPLRGLTSPS